MRWREIRAGLIALAIGLGLVEGCPIPPPGEEHAWQRGYVAVLRPVQRAILAPVAWLPDLRVTQRFALFQAAEPDRYRLEIRARASDGTERVVFAAGADRGPYAAMLAQRRLRGVWNPTQRATKQYAAFARWFSTVVFAEHADVQVVTFRMERLRIEDGVPRGLGTYAFETVHYRGAR